jgi:unsaturated rhamnogalacturonyl hydrolase
MAILDVLDFLPSMHPKRGELAKILVSVLDALLAYQDESGMWYQVVDKAGQDGNYLETSCTGMFAYSLLKALRTGLISKEHYRKQALKALEGIKATYLRKDDKGQLHLGGICSVAGLGGNPYRDGTFHYYICEPVVEDDFKGVGPFILACLEAEQSR